MKSSARNQLAGTVTHIEHSNGSCLVTLASAGGIEIHAQISSFSLKRLKLSVGSPVIAMIKAASVVLATDLAPMTLSAENCLHGTVKRVEQGSVNNVVTLDINNEINLCATITLYSSETLALEQDRPATAVFNANQVMLGVLI
ncbi:TOBE domain-containing protein [Neisseria flava]|jgi:molybdenum-pterin binding domain|uniref:TOBE domain-containing protein n=1 Tax=Neisseria sicca TaxID=490 RepID=UPI0003070F90|nr:TOBE domain-containing protein [Neisseria sicca]MBY6284681.1 TOBE domain-containing protein [Neisseria flava]OFJ78781.1 molybdenum transport protein ModE [Neisseria sp. HMSC072F04]QTM23269.1 TOBE domain-containing protein [Neisseria sicca]